MDSVTWETKGTPTRDSNEGANGLFSAWVLKPLKPWGLGLSSLGFTHGLKGSDPNAPVTRVTMATVMVSRGRTPAPGF